MVHYKLIYFNFRGRAEPIRTLFALAGQEFEDVRITKDEWPEIKKTTPFGHLPVLEVDGEQITQTVAILRYLGRQFNFAGKNHLEEAEIDMFIDQVFDFINEVHPFMVASYRGDAEKEFIKSSVSWGDVFFATMASNEVIKLDAFFEGYPELETYVNRVLAILRIKEYMDSRPPPTQLIL